MADKARAKMRREDRAKQFAPFSALNGLEEALKQKELELGYCERVEPAEDAALELDASLRALRVGDELVLEYYSGRQYSLVTGALTRIDTISRLLFIDDLPVPIDDILFLSKVSDRRDICPF